MSQALLHLSTSSRSSLRMRRLTAASFPISIRRYNQGDKDSTGMEEKAPTLAEELLRVAQEKAAEKDQQDPAAEEEEEEPAAMDSINPSSDSVKLKQESNKESPEAGLDKRGHENDYLGS